jgi:eukaryotic-like serine/threonine-protein kinase
VSDAVIGQILLGKYRVERVLGQGGMGLVVEATHLQLGQRVAIKFVLPEVLHNPEVRGRFLREAQAAVRLKSAHVARVLDIGTLETGSPFIVMELLEGEDLASIVRRAGPLPVATAAAWVLEACEALAEAHALGIIHRDLKPGNLFLAYGAGGMQSIKVFDFGISKVTAGAGLELSLTRTVSVLGSPGYASPEQLRATKNVDHRTDVWALGVTLYQLVSGDMPWTADTLPELSIKIAIDPAPPLSPQLRVPAAFEQVIRRCLEKDPARRFASVAALAAALGPFAPNGRAAVDRVRSAGQVAGDASPGTTMQSSAGEVAAPGSSGRGRARMYGILGALLLGGGITAFVAMRDPGTTTKAPSAVDARPVIAPPADASPPPKVVTPVAVIPDAAPAPRAVVSTPDAAPAGNTITTRPDPGREDDRYRDLLNTARRLGKSACGSTVRLYETAIDINPRGAEALAGLGTCLVELKDYDRAISNFRAALAISHRNPEALIGAAEAYQYKGNSAAAILHYKQYLEVSPRGEKAEQARRNLAKLATGTEGTKQTDDDLFGGGSNKPK